MKVPVEPVVFMKATSAICGPDDDIVIPKGATKTDWQVELGIVVGRPAKYVTEIDAMSHVAGYCLINASPSEPSNSKGKGQWVKVKSADTFGPIGSWLVTTSEIPDPQTLTMWLEVNGRRYQNGATRTMIFGVRQLISYLSRVMSVQPGDIISTGTPPGVGMGQKPPAYLKAGDCMKL